MLTKQQQQQQQKKNWRMRMASIPKKRKSPSFRMNKFFDEPR